MVWNLVFISLGVQFRRRHVIPMATRHVVQSSLKVQDGVSFFFKMESAQPVLFLPQHHELNEHEFEQTLGDSEGQERLVCCSPPGHKGTDTT